MSDYRVIHRKQDLGMKISSLYRQEQLAVGIIDVSSGSDLASTLKWFVSSFDFNDHFNVLLFYNNIFRFLLSC